MHEKIYQDVQIDLDRFHPMGDMVLVKRLPDPEESAGGILIPETSRNENRPKDPKERVRRGVVVACGPGDRGWWFVCGDCQAPRCLTPSSKRKPGHEEFTLAIVTNCETCGARNWVAASYDAWDQKYAVADDGQGSDLRPMSVKIGDIILWERRPANECRINDEEYTLLHEESQILAVLDEMEVAA